jgi:hypothetical protein
MEKYEVLIGLLIRHLKGVVKTLEKMRELMNATKL